MTRINHTDLDVLPLCLGGNIFGWTVDEADSLAVLDAYADAGGNFIDTADVYSAWVPGHQGGESETIIGRWMTSRGSRDRVVLATKVGADGGLGAQNIREKVEASLRRLRTDRIDLLYAHRDDPDTTLEETLHAFGELVAEGKVRYVAASNYQADRLSEALAVSDRAGLPRYVALQPHYNLVERGEYEGDLAQLCQREGVACAPYSGLARGFLTGKYRPQQAGADTRRGQSDGSTYLEDPNAVALLSRLDEIAADRGVSVGAVSLAWLLSKPTVVAPIASARTPEQLADLLPSVSLTLDEQDLARLAG